MRTAYPNDDLVVGVDIDGYGYSNPIASTRIPNDWTRMISSTFAT